MSEIRILGADAGQQRAWLFSRLSEGQKDGRTAVVFVPEQYTLQTERDLLTGMHLPGLLNLDVISPSRLKTMVRETAGSSGRDELDDTGRAMAIHRALYACEKDLVYYQRLGSLYGAVPRMDQTLRELQEEQLTPEVLEELASAGRGGAQRAKYLDLSRIMRSYEALLSDRFADPVLSWRDLCARLASSGLWQGTDLYVYGFDTLRPDLRDLILSSAEVCRSVSVLLTMSDPSSPSARIFRTQRDSALKLTSALREQGHTVRLEYPNPVPPAPEDALGFLSRHLFCEGNETFPGDPSPALTLYAAPHPTGESLAVVSVLRAWHEEGIAWSRMAVALPRSFQGLSSLLAAFSRHGIPFFISRKEEVARHGAARLFSSALACVARGYDTDLLLEMASSGFGVLSPEEGAHLTEYVLAWGIARSRWRRPFTRGEEAGEAEALRLRLLAPLDRLHDALRQAPNGRESALALYRFLREEGVYEQLQERRQLLENSGHASEAVIDRQVWELLMKLLDQFVSLLGDRKVSLREVSQLISGALERASLSALPETEEGVPVGEIGHMLPGRTEALVLPGMNEGVMNIQPVSLFSDTERRAVRDLTGKSVGMDHGQLGMLARSDYVRTFSLPEKRLFVSFCLRDESGSAQLPGEPVAELRRLFPLLKARGGLADTGLPFRPDCPSLALEGLGPLLRGLYSGELPDLSPDWKDALRLLLRDGDTGPEARRMLAPLLDPPSPRKIPAGTAVRLFRAGRVSISRLECFASCPYRHFLKYGLRPLLPRSFVFTAGDAGDFFHLALQQYMDRAVREPEWPHLDADRASALMEAILDQLTQSWEEGPLRESALGRWQGEEYLRRVRHAASVLTRFASNADFQPLGTEMEFGVPGGLPPLILNLEDGHQIALQGTIDRLDLYHGPDADYLRVLDLKSSEKTLDPARMDSGEQLQLMIYLQAALRGRPGALPAGALYFPVQDRDVDAPSPEAAEEKRLKEVQLKGVVLAEENVLRAMDRDISPFSLPKAFNQDGSISKSASWALPPETLRGLMDAAVKKAEEICGGIRSGAISASPSVSEQRSPCSYCEYASVCPKRREDERPLPKGFSFQDVGKSLLQQNRCAKEENRL